MAAAAFLKEIHLIDFAMEKCGVRDLSRLTNASKLLGSELKGVRVVTTHRSDLKQSFKIAAVSQCPASEFTFEYEGRQISIVEYFQTQYGLRLQYPWLPVILKSNKKTAFPMEYLKIAPSQRALKKLDGTQVSEMIKATIQKPFQRKKQIESSSQSILKFNQNEYLKSFGLQVSNSLMTIPARVLPAPNVVFAKGKSTSGRDGAWNLKNVTLCSTPTVSSLAFVFFVRVDKSTADEIRNSLIRKWQQTGVRIEAKNIPVVISNPFQQNAVHSALRSAFTEATHSCGARCQMIVCIIDKEPKKLYEDIKRITLSEAGVLSQCIQYSHVRRPDGIKDQYAANVAMKLNIKLGGATNTVEKLPGCHIPTMLVGADVTHPSPGSGAPSLAAVATSVDKNATRYNTFLRCQKSRLEIIADMEQIIGKGLDRFKAANSIYPSQIIFFRDGVSSGQFAAVRLHEIKAIHKALYERGLEDKCKLVFLVVQKRHHIRLFPIDREDRSGNCLPGTVV